VKFVTLHHSAYTRLCIISDANFLTDRCGRTAILASTTIPLSSSVAVLGRPSFGSSETLRVTWKSPINSTNITLSRSWPVRMMTVTFFSCLSDYGQRHAKEQFPPFPEKVPLIYITQYVLFHLQQKPLMFPMTAYIWDTLYIYIYIYIYICIYMHMRNRYRIIYQLISLEKVDFYYNITTIPNTWQAVRFQTSEQIKAIAKLTYDNLRSWRSLDAKRIETVGVMDILNFHKASLLITWTKSNHSIESARYLQSIVLSRR
jgi:hypothetical protein